MYPELDAHTHIPPAYNNKYLAWYPSSDSGSNGDIRSKMLLLSQERRTVEVSSKIRDLEQWSLGVTVMVATITIATGTA